MRLLRPNQGRRAQETVHSTDIQISMLSGVKKIPRMESLTVGSLMAKVQWKAPREASPETRLKAPETIPARQGLPGFGESESLTASTPKISLPLTTPRLVTEEIPETEPIKVASIKNAYSAGCMLPLVGTGQIPNRRSLTVNNLMETVQWQAPKKITQTSVSEDEINWD